MGYRDIVISSGIWEDFRILGTPIRREVFIIEQRVPESMEWDEEDTTSEHWIAHCQQQPIATLRLTPQHQIGRVAVLAAYRRQGVASQLIQAALRQHPEHPFWIHAQTQALAFWQTLGFRQEGEIFDEAGIPHVFMRLAAKSSV